MPAAPVFYPPKIEQMLPGEDKTVRELCETFDIILNKTAADDGHAVRSVRAKARALSALREISRAHQPLPDP
jgi:hypothetical protein